MISANSSKRFLDMTTTSFWVDIRAADLPRLAAALLAEKYAGSLKATDELRAFCERHQIPNKWASW
jgi:hypothetical protein